MPFVTFAGDVQPAATYASRDLIPPSPAERLLEEPPEPRHHTARIPFVPADRHEALDQVNLLRSNGVLLSHLLVLSGQGSILPKAGVFQPCPLPVQVNCCGVSAYLRLRL